MTARTSESDIRTVLISSTPLLGGGISLRTFLTNPNRTQPHNDPTIRISFPSPSLLFPRIGSQPLSHVVDVPLEFQFGSRGPGVRIPPPRPNWNSNGTSTTCES